jgi:transmembrane sensor
MSDPASVTSVTSVADREAAEWHVRLGERPVSADTLQAFKTWRQIAGNAEAYSKIESLWRRTGSLSADGDIRALTQATLRASKARPRRVWSRRLFAAAAVMGAAVAVTAGLFLWLPTRGVYATEIGGGRVVALDDGTRVQLDTDTRIKVRFANGERRILLEQGQALFTVAHDASRPFRVEAGGTEVTALGTVFDVRREAAGARVTLVQGSVAVSDAQAETRNWRLTAGEQVQTFRPNPAPIAVDAATETSWSQGRLVFKATPLREAVAEINRYLPEKIVLDDVAAANVPVNGQFATGDRDAFVGAVSDLFDLTARPRPDGGVRLTARSAGG